MQSCTDSATSTKFEVLLTLCHKDEIFWSGKSFALSSLYQKTTRMELAGAENFYNKLIDLLQRMLTFSG